MKQTFVVLCLFLASVAASAQTQDCVTLTHQALELSGFNKSLDPLAAELASPQFMQQMRGNESTEEFARIFTPIMQKDFNVESLRKDIEQRVAAHCDPRQMAQTVERLQTPLVAKMIALEAATDSPEGQEKLKKYIRIATMVPPTDERIEAIDAVDVSMGASDFVTDVVLAMFHGMLTGAGAPAEIVTQIQEHRSDLKAQMQNRVELSMTVTYHGVTRPELQQYAKEMGTQPLKGFNAQVNKLFVEIVEERSRALGQELKKAVAARKASSGKS
jgi:hypothetical protein